MSTLDKYGFNDPNIDSFKKVRLFIDTPCGILPY